MQAACSCHTFRTGRSLMALSTRSCVMNARLSSCTCACIAQVMNHVHYEDENTRYVDIGPVNKVINMLCCWFEDPDSLAFKK